MSNILAASAGIFFGEAGSALSEDLRAQRYPMPSYDQLLRSRLRLDYMSMRFQQKLFLRSTVLRYMLIDSSPSLATISLW